jgi:hypothetical protein
LHKAQSYGQPKRSQGNIEKLEGIIKKMKKHDAKSNCEQIKQELFKLRTNNDDFHIRQGFSKIGFNAQKQADEFRK